MKKARILPVLVALSFLDFASAKPRVPCKVQGDLILWQTAYCAREVETDDCDNENVTSCRERLARELKAKSDCEQKTILRDRINLSCKKDPACIKQIPSIVKYGC
jgi:hypothetical protein